ncbi:hypothetical protein AB0B57_01570 [Micromonospora sp. NPDC049101]|uniref:hypothetical protein n=1 Tax=unclassified Micromonospora TaxID=2617518 RepID=UPI0033DA8DF6
MLTNEQIIGQALDRIEAGYVFPAKVVDIDAAIRRRLAAGEYDGLAGPALCETVIAHLQEACPDKHLRLLWSDQPQSLDPADEDGGRAAFLALLRAENQGIRRVEHLTLRSASKVVLSREFPRSPMARTALWPC